MNVDEVIFRLLLIDGNESNELDSETRLLFEQLVIALVKMKYDVRWCSNLACPCWPESRINSFLINKTLAGFLIKNGIYESIVALLNEPQKQPIRTVWAADGNSFRRGTEFLL